MLTGPGHLLSPSRGNSISLALHCPPIIRSCLPLRLQPPIEYPPVVKLPSTCWRVLATYCCLPGGTSSLSKTRPLACIFSISLALRCLLLMSIHAISPSIVPFLPWSTIAANVAVEGHCCFPQPRGIHNQGQRRRRWWWQRNNHAATTTVIEDCTSWG